MSAIDEIEFLKIQTHVLKVQINCVGCRKKVKKLLKKIEGVYQVSMDVEEQKVTVSGNVDAEMVIMRLLKSGKHAELLSLQELANQEKGSDKTQYRDGEYQNPELLNGDYHNMELLKWLSDENYQNQVHSQINNVRASKRQPMLPQLYESLGNEKSFKQSMAFESQEGEGDNKFSTTIEMDNPHVHQDYASILGRKENSMMDSLGPKFNFPYFTTMEGKEHVDLAGQQLQYHYPPYNMMNNMQVYQYRNPSPMTVNPYMQRMHPIEHMDNVYMHQPRMVMDHKFDMVPPISYWQNMNMNMNSYHI